MQGSRILIVEDEALISAGIEFTLTQQGCICSIVDNGADAITAIPQFPPDLILMDIGLKGKLDGLSTAAIIRRRSLVPIVFISEHNSRQVFELAKETRPANYISKPFSDAELIKAVELGLCQPVQEQGPPAKTGSPIERVSDGIFIYTDNEYRKILFTDILFIQSDGMRSFLYCTGGKTYRIAISSNHVVEQLDWAGFVKTSKSSYVNIHKVESIKNDELGVEGYVVTLSKTYREEFLARIKKLKQ
jgi:two-component system, response regulator PdtaR